MNELPRIAFGSVQPGFHLQDVLWGFLEALRREGISGQVFCSQSRFDDLGSLASIDERRLRHLDSWLMSPEVCRWFLVDGSHERDLSIVIGRFDAVTCDGAPGGSLTELCELLSLPAVVVLDVSVIDPCCPPCFPPEAAGMLLAGCQSGADLARWQTWLEAISGIPVFGGLCRESCLANLEPVSIVPGTQQVDALGDDFERHARLTSLLELAGKVSKLTANDPWKACHSRPKSLRVAMAYDEIFNCYFPDTMDCLESLGAQLIDFSPLRSESIPHDVDLVWFGCGHPEQCPERLSRNICLQQSLQAYARGGGRVYAEGGGLAYICETMRCDSGSYPMAGLLPADASFGLTTGRPVELDLLGSSWFGQRQVRGYLNPCWSLETHEPCLDYSAGSEQPMSLVGCQQVYGSLVHLHFTSQPHLLASLWDPCFRRGSMR